MKQRASTPSVTLICSCQTIRSALTLFEEGLDSGCANSDVISVEVLNGCGRKKFVIHERKDSVCVVMDAIVKRLIFWPICQIIVMKIK